VIGAIPLRSRLNERFYIAYTSFLVTPLLPKARNVRLLSAVTTAVKEWIVGACRCLNKAAYDKTNEK